MKSLVRLLYFVKPYWRPATLSILLVLGMVVSDLSIPRLTQRVVDQGILAGNLSVILTTSAVMFGMATLGALFAVGNTIMAVRVAQSVAADVRSALVHQVQALSFGNLDHLQTSQLLVRATSDVNMVQMIMMLGLRMLIRAPLWMFGSFGMLLLTGHAVVSVTLALMPFLLGMIAFFLIKATPLFRRVQARLDALNQVLQENLAGVRVVKAFVRAAHESARFDRVNAAYTQTNLQVMQMLAFLFPSLMFLINLGIAGVIWFGGQQVIAGELSMGQIMASFNYLAFTLFPMLMLAGMMGPLSAADASAGRILEVLDSVPEVGPPAAPQLPATLRGRVAFEGVTFRYNGQEQAPVLKDVTLVAEPGETVAILGATGSGKSSLVHLIPRFYDVAAGRVTLDGVDVREWPLDALRGQVGLAMQEAVLFSGTIRANLRYGRPEATDAEIEAAARVAQAHDFITALPAGYDTVLGQRGVNLSGGQKQRLSIARALVVQPRILILDDSTSAVDVETEAELQAALAPLMHASTTFVIAQRISTVLNADKIVVLERGEVAASGTHADLLATSPIYREIYASQLGEGRGANHG